MKRTDANIPLIREFFGCTLQEMKALTPADREELGSAIRNTLPIEAGTEPLALEAGS